MLQAVDHINIVVSNMETSLSFYTELLGFRETKRAMLEGAWIDQVVGLKGVKAEVVYIEAPESGPRIELIHYLHPAGQKLSAHKIPNTIGLRHIAFRVQDIQQVYKQLKQAGVQFVGAPARVPSDVVQHQRGNKRLCYFLDPDGVLLELAEYITQ